MSLDLTSIQHELKTQDNAITADPLFVVFQRSRVCGMDPGYSDTYQWVNPENDYKEADVKKTKALDRYYDLYSEQPKHWRKVYYTVKDVFVTACFTRKGCEEYLRRNGHNLREPYIYVESMFRNEEMKELRNALLEGHMLYSPENFSVPLAKV